MASAVVVLKHETSTFRRRHNFISINFKVGVDERVREVTSPDKFGSDPMSGRDATWEQHIRVLWLFYCFLFFNRATAHTRNPIVAHNSSNNAVWCKEDPFWDEKCVVVKFGGLLPPKTTLKWPGMGNYQAKKMSNNFETVRDTRNMSMNHDYETEVDLSDSVNKTYVKCPLAEKSLWLHIRLAKKPRYLGNHASQIKSYYGTLSGSHIHSFRIRHEKSPEAPPGG